MVFVPPFFSWEYPNRCILWSCLSIFMVVPQTCLTVILWLTSVCTQVHSSIPSFWGGRSQFSVFKFFKLLAVCSLAIAFAVTTGVCKRRKSVFFSDGRKFSIFQKTCPKCHHNLYHRTRLGSVPFSHFQFDVDSKTLRRMAVLMPWDGLWGFSLCPCYLV